jgi:hypothetical protein
VQCASSRDGQTLAIVLNCKNSHNNASGLKYQMYSSQRRLRAHHVPRNGHAIARNNRNCFPAEVQARPRVEVSGFTSLRSKTSCACVSRVKFFVQGEGASAGQRRFWSKGHDLPTGISLAIAPSFVSSWRAFSFVSLRVAHISYTGAHVATQAAGRTPTRGLAQSRAGQGLFDLDSLCIAWALLCRVCLRLHPVLFPAGGPFPPSLSF